MLVSYRLPELCACPTHDVPTFQLCNMKTVRYVYRRLYILSYRLFNKAVWRGTVEKNVCVLERKQLRPIWRSLLFLHLEGWQKAPDDKVIMVHQQRNEPVSPDNKWRCVYFVRSNIILLKGWVCMCVGSHDPRCVGCRIIYLRGLQFVAGSGVPRNESGSASHQGLYSVLTGFSICSVRSLWRHFNLPSQSINHLHITHLSSNTIPTNYIQA
jgi:hypothetical protein